MKPSQVSAELRRVAAEIDNCSKPVRPDLVARDLRRVAADVAGLDVALVGTDGSLATVHIKGDFQGVRLDHDLDMDMDGNYAAWKADPIPVGGPLWDDLMAAVGESQDLIDATTAYNEGPPSSEGEGAPSPEGEGEGEEAPPPSSGAPPPEGGGEEALPPSSA